MFFLLGRGPRTEAFGDTWRKELRKEREPEKFRSRIKKSTCGTDNGTPNSNNKYIVLISHYYHQSNTII